MPVHLFHFGKQRWGLGRGSGFLDQLSLSSDTTDHPSFKLSLHCLHPVTGLSRKKVDEAKSVSLEKVCADHLAVKSGNVTLVHNGKCVKYHSKFITR